MKHLHLYVPNELYEAIHKNASEKYISKSRYVVEQLNHLFEAKRQVSSPLSKTRSED